MTSPNEDFPSDITAKKTIGDTWQYGVNQKFIQKLLLSVIAFVVLFQLIEWAFFKSKDFLFLVLFSWLLGIAITPLVNRLAKTGIKRGWATLIVISGLIVFILGFFYAFGQLFISQLSSLITQIPDLVDGFVIWLNSTFNLNLSTTSIQNSLNISNPELTNYAQNLAGGLLGIVSSIVGFIFNLFTVLLFTFYFAAEAPTIRKTIAGWLPAKQQLVFSTVWKVTTEKTGGFVISRIILAGLNAVFTSIFLLSIDVPYWLPLGIFTGVISQFIPTIGSYIGGLIPATVAIVNQPLDGLWVIIFVTIYQQIENYVFTPRISSLTMDIHPAVAFASVFIFCRFLRSNWCTYRGSSGCGNNSLDSNLR